MKIVHIFAQQLFAFKYDSEDHDELERLLDIWTNQEYLRVFFEGSPTVLDFYGIDIERAILETQEEAIKLENLLISSSNSPLTLDKLFQPLSDNAVSRPPFSKQKAKRRWLRLYALKIDPDIYVITGGTIKTSQAMQETEQALAELSKLNICRDYLIKNRVFDDASFFDFMLEL